MADTDIIDIVDDADTVIGQVTRKQAHAENLLHRSVHIIVVKDDGQIVVQHRKRTKSSYPLHLAVSAAGHVDAGEIYDETAKRELFEELGINAPLHPIIKHRRYDPGVENEWVQLYVCHHNGPFTNWETEAENLLSFSMNELDRSMHDYPQLFENCFITDVGYYKNYLRDTRSSLV